MKEIQYSTKRRIFKEKLRYKSLEINNLNGFAESTTKQYKEILIMLIQQKNLKYIMLYCLLMTTVISFGKKVSPIQNEVDARKNLTFHKPYVCSDKNTRGWNGGLTDGSWKASKINCFATNNTNEFPKHVTIDLKGIVKLNKVKLGVPPFGSTKTVDIEVSTGGNSFKKVASVVFQQKKAERKTVTFPTVEVNYLRLTFADHYQEKGRFNPNTMFLTEVEAFWKKVSPSQNELYTGKEFSHAFTNPKDNPKFPNVLLIGDSISIGYTVEVRKLLKGKADVYRIPTNARYTSFGLKNLDKWFGNRKWDIIHFNWGLWDICYRAKGLRDKINGKLTTAPEQYRKHLESIVIKLKKVSTKLIWCSTTPVPKVEEGRIQGDEVKYNKIAQEVMEKYNVQINDLYTHALIKISEIQKTNKKTGIGDVHGTKSI